MRGNLNVQGRDCFASFAMTIAISVHGLEALVDTGAGYSVIPRPVLEARGCQPYRTQRVIRADGRIEAWMMAQIDRGWHAGSL